MQTGILSITEWEYNIIGFAQTLGQLIDNICKTIDELDNSLKKTVQIVDQFNNKILDLTTSLKIAQSSSSSKTEIYNRGTIDHAYNANAAKNLAPDETKREGTDGSELEHTYKNAQTTLKISESALKIADKVRPLPTPLKNTKLGLEIFNRMGATVAAAEKAANFLAGEGDKMEGFSSLLEMIVGGLMIIETVSKFEGPVGWAVAAGAFILHEGINFSINEQKRAQQAKAREKQIAANLQAFDISEQQADYMMTNSGKIADQKYRAAHNYHLWHPKTKDPMLTHLKKDPHSYDLNITPPVMTFDNQSSSNINLPPDLRMSYNESNRTPAVKAPKSFMQKTFNERQALMGAAYDHGMDGFFEKYGELRFNAREYDKTHKNAHRFDEVTMLGNEVLYDLTYSVNKDKKVFAPSRRTTGGNNRTEKTGNCECNNVTVNLNGPLVDAFSINVTNMQEGINNLKRKVEDALIEVLNAAKATK